MAFVKLDCGMLDSTLWVDRAARELFVTALLMAVPVELTEPSPQFSVRDLSRTGFEVPPGWYGFVPAAGTGIIRRAGMDAEDGLPALERLGEPDSESRTPDFEGRRLVRVEGGYIVLNFIKYRERDHTAAERQKRFRERKKSNGVISSRNGATSRNGNREICDSNVTSASASASANLVDRGVGEGKPDDSGLKAVAKSLIAYLSQKTGRSFRAVDSAVGPIVARLKEPEITEEGVRKMIDRQVAIWGKDPKMREHLTPTTLFRPSNFNNYWSAKDFPIPTGTGGSQSLESHNETDEEREAREMREVM